MENNNYITIQGWMRNELDLTGTELIIYAIIYGFSQDGHSRFTGSASYLADWSGATRQSVMNNLKKLLDKDLIVKHEIERNGVKFCEYSVSNLTGCKNILQGCQNILHNNINIIKKKSISKEILKEILDYLNEKCETHYRLTNKKTESLVNARLNDGFTVEDFKKVIDNKAAEWKDNPQMCQYLRPDTLFGTKFESYLNQKAVATPPKPGIEINPKQREGMNDIVDWGM